MATTQRLYRPAPRSTRASPLTAHRVQTVAPDEHAAVEELYRGMGDAELSGLVFFCSPGYDLGRLAGAVATRFPRAPAIGCTSAGQIGPLGLQPGGIVAVGLSSRELVMTTHVIQDLDDGAAQASRIGESLQRRLRASPGWSAFGLLLVDGLSMAEEHLTAALYQSMGNVPLVGGSAGDDLAFERTDVYYDGQFLSRAGVFALFETTAPFHAFKFQHVVPSDPLLVITAADPVRRLVHEINGKPAARAYAELVGIPVDRLDAGAFSRHPLAMDVAGDLYVRSIHRREGDSLAMLCAIEEGLVLSLATSVDAEAAAVAAFAEARAAVPSPQVVIGCDCVLRRLEYEHRGEVARISALMARERVVGFSTYGEQYNGLHVNQTFTGVAIGG